MTVEDALAVVEHVLEQGRLTKVQELVFREAWDGKSYLEIARHSGYDPGYIKDAGSKLWQILSDAFAERVTKHNFQSVLKRFVNRERRGQNGIAWGQPLTQPSQSSDPTFQTALAATLLTSPTPAPSPQAIPYQDWGEAVSVSTFYGRVTELALLQEWAVSDRCKLVAVLGMGGLGKTALSVKLAQQVIEAEGQCEFEYVIWRSLRQAPPVSSLLTEIISILAKQQGTELPTTVEGQISCLMKYLQEHRCLLVLDNVESVLQSGEQTRRYRVGYEGYGQLIERISDERHQSCLVLTSREKPGGISIREGVDLPVRSLQLKGLSQAEGQQILATKGLAQSSADCKRLVDRYCGNPLAIKIAAATIQSLFGGDIAAFLDQGTAVFGDLWELLNQQFQRLSPLEKQVMYWLAINREWVTLASLQEDLFPQVIQRDLLEALDSLQGRSLIETSIAGFTQQPVIMEYMTEQLVVQVYEEIRTWSKSDAVDSENTDDRISDVKALDLSSRLNVPFSLLQTHALIKAQTEDYIRDAQIRLVLQPVADKLLIAFKDKQAAETHLYSLLSSLRGRSARQVGYAGGNLLNLLWQLQSDLSDRDFSHLAIRQAYLSNTTLHRTNFTAAEIEQSVFAETFGGVVSVAFSPDGKWLATSDTNGEIHVWQVPLGKQLISWKGHSHWTWAIAFSPDGQLLASVSDDFLVKLWNVKTGACLQTFRGHTCSISSLAFSPDGQLLATSSQDATIRLWNVNPTPTAPDADGECAFILKEHTSRVWAVTFSPDGKTLASCSEDQTIKLWSLSTKECQQTLQGHSHWVKSIAFSPDGRLLASGSFDQTVKLWAVQTGDCISTFQGHIGTVTTVVFSPDGQQVASSSYDQTVRMWAVSSGQCLKTLQGHNNRVWSVAYSPDGQLLASGGDDHATKLWNTKTGQCTKTIKGHTNSVLGIALHPDGHQLASGHEDQTVRLWDISSGTCLQTLYGHSNRIWSVAYAVQPASSSRNGTRERGSENVILASGSADRTIKLWNPATGRCIRTLQGHASWVWAIAISPNYQVLASGSYDRTIKLWDIETGKCLQTLEGHSGPVVSVMFSADGRWLASSSFDATIKLWDMQTGTCAKTFTGHENSVWQIAFSSDAQRLASASFDQTVKLWDIDTEQCIQTFKGHDGPVATIAFYEGDRCLISGSADQTIKIWDTNTNECIQTLQGHQGLVYSLIISSKCDLNTKQPATAPTLMSGSFDETVRLWSLATGECLNTLRAPRPYEGMKITQTTGLTEAQKVTLKALGACET